MTKCITGGKRRGGRIFPFILNPCPDSGDEAGGGREFISTCRCWRKKEGEEISHLLKCSRYPLVKEGWRRWMHLVSGSARVGEAAINSLDFAVKSRPVFPRPMWV